MVVLVDEYDVPLLDVVHEEENLPKLRQVMCNFSPQGRVDVVMRTRDYLYVVELKLDKSADAAINQIDRKKYAQRFALCGLPVVKVGINFSSEEKNITDWKILPETLRGQNYE